MSLRYRVLFSLFLVFALLLIGCERGGSEESAEAAAAEAPLAETEEAVPTPEPTEAPAVEPAEEESGILVDESLEPGRTDKETSSPQNPLAETFDETSSSPMAIETLRARDYPTSEIVIEETLEPGSNYQRFIASYMSDGHKIYALLTIPNDQGTGERFPTIVFLHGFIRPQTYVTTADYVATQDGLAESGFVTFKPDFRGHGRSEGIASGAHFSEAYIVDTLNAISALENYENTDPDRIGLWGHSNGGETGLAQSWRAWPQPYRVSFFFNHSNSICRRPICS